MNVICDTNSLTALRLGNQHVLSALENADIVFLSVIVMGELIYGYGKGTKKPENLAFLKSFLAKPTVRVLPISEETAHVYAQLRIELKQLGQPIPTNDLWIASQAIEIGAILLSNDAHFGALAGLRKKRF